jgi:hypothetical protein
MPLCVALMASGCSAKEKDQSIVNEPTGVVDVSLPPEAQSRQRALVEVFRNLQLAGEFDELPARFPTILFRESKADFYGEANVLESWDWDGPPVENEVPVKLRMIKMGKDYGTIEYTRVYSVEKRGKQLVITRKS